MDAGYKWTGLDAARLDRIGGLLEREYLATGRLIGCDVAVARHGHIAYRRTFGLMDRERAAPVREDTLWRIYSMTKPVASVALMMLFERGLFQLNDPVCDWVPSWRDQRVWVSGQGEAMVTEPVARPVSFRDLLSHTAGLGYSGAFAPRDAPHPIDLAYRAAAVQTIGSPDSATVLLDKLGPLPLRFQPGSAWHYSAATDVCGALVELISGQPLGDFLEAEIFAPLGMKDTSFCVPPEKRDRFAANYRRLEDGALALFDDPGASPYCQPPAFHSGGGGLVSTTADYLRFCEMLRRGGELDGARILGRRTVELMRANHLPGGGDLGRLNVQPMPAVEEGMGFGLGFAMTTDPALRGSLAAEDYYWYGAAGTLFWVDPQEELSVVFMTQLMLPAYYEIRGALKNLIYAAIVD